ncbi:hypothetical protein HYS28_01335 [Candidatus Uhrbacteria bacterium]|nr:hypothetical protein [Candidatus Uhrbacteria bacterium]
MLDLRPIFQPSFWFDLTPTAMSPAFERTFFVMFAALVLAGAAGRIVAKSRFSDAYDRIVAMRAATLAFVFGLLGYVLYFFTFEEIQFFGSRFWFLAWFIGLVVCVVRLVRYAKKEVPALRHRDQSRVEANKYLPRSNRR